MDFNNKVILLTGASSGIGYELAKKLAKDDCSLVLASRRISLLEELAGKIRRSGNRVSAIECDLSDKSEIANLVKKVMYDYGRIDAAILNSGTSYRLKIEEGSLDAAEEVMKVNAMSYIYFFNELLPVMKGRGGIIAGVSSLADTRGFPYSGVYSASKAAASRLLESYRVELRKFNIRVITIRPGFVRTPMVDKNKFYMPFLMDASKAAEIIYRGLRKEKRIIQFPLPTVILAKLVRFIPNSVFDFLSAKVK